MNTPLVQYVAVAGQRDFDVTFPFLSPTHVEVRVDGKLASVLEWVNDTRLRIATPLGTGQRVELRRNTPIDTQLVKFQNGAVLTQEDLNIAVQQLLYKQQEITSLYDRAIGRTLDPDTGGDPDRTAEEIAQEIADMVLEEEVLANFRQRIADIDLTAAQLAQQAVDITNQGDQLTAQGIQLISANDAISAEANARLTLNGHLQQLRTDHLTLAGVVDALANLEDGSGLATVIQQEQSARIDGDYALAATLHLLGAKNGPSSAFILNLNTVRVGPTETLATRLDAINTRAGASEALILAEQTARANGDSAEATARTTLGAAIRSELGAAITTEQQVRANAISAEATARTTLAATLRGETDTKIGAAIQTEQQARADAISAEATARTTLAATLRGETASAIQTEQTARANAITAEANARTALAATLRGETDTKVSAAVLTEQNARVAGDQAEATARNALAATLRSETDTKVTAHVKTETDARVAADAAEASARTTLASTLRGEIASSIQTEATTRANADGVFTNLFTLLGAKNTAGTAFVLDDSKVQLSNGTALGVRLSGIDTAIGNNASAIVNEQTARTNADNALSQSIQVVSTNVGNLSASVSTLSQSVDGVKARYGVSLNVNGYVTGFVQNNDGTTGSFDILADKFRIVVPGQTPKQVFSVDANGVKIEGNLIVSGSINSGQLAVGAATASASAYAATSLGLLTSWQDALAATITTVGGKVRIDFCARVDLIVHDAGNVPVNFRVLRGSTVVREGVLVTAFGRQEIVISRDHVSPGSTETHLVYSPVSGNYPVFLIDEGCPAGTHTYTVQLSCATGLAFERTLMVLETRR